MKIKEELTNKLFAYDINTDITKQELALEPGIPNPNPEIVKTLEEINQEALNIATEFINFSSELSNNVNNQNAFCFYYNSFRTNRSRK